MPKDSTGISRLHFLLVAAHHVAKFHDHNQPMQAVVAQVTDLVPQVEEDVIQALWITANTAVLDFKLNALINGETK